MNRPVGPGPQPLRAMAGNMFPNQQSAASRNPSLASNRLQNGKLAGNMSGWGVGIPMGSQNAPINPQSRSNTAGLSSFAQTIGGNQNQAQFDPSEFPSLGNSQSQQQNTAAQQIWSNPNIRNTQNTPVQRTQNQPSTSQAPQPSATPLNQQQSQDEGSGTATMRFPGADDYHFGGQGGVGQLAGLAQPQTGSVEEFPPLGGLGEMGQDRRAGMLQNPAYGAEMNGGRQPERTVTSTIGDSRVPPGRLGGGVSRTPGAGQADVERNGRSAREGEMPLRQLQADQGFTTDVDLPEMTQPPRQKRTSEMTDMERFGLPGLLAMITEGSPDYSSLAVGQDLTVLGLDLNRPENSPLYPTFGTPFGDTNARAVMPDFALPPVYTVTNVPPLHSKMASFSDETLFAIFYQYPRDIMQEIAAQELYNRDWRWHKELRQWMMKEQSFPQPVKMNPVQERGYYVFFDVLNWRRERREFVLTYDHLDQRHSAGTTGPSL
ncbi:hypothetical protein K402DRAFT_392680 [Aulographum hederae CBS 113979]|uniref:NOT2/NOT3/NOT5 C-terminal domain-containing protein n=1 Tax=Aulographum hederae CBS 113979 TaxID=1176131 RepID=A0A6G1H316_9PEZI|nr:hypothetical protein K402DRAFT_392680 [Aulographum hederae CBS 113979]